MRAEVKVLNRYHAIKHFDITFVKSRFPQIVRPLHMYISTVTVEIKTMVVLKPVYHDMVARRNFHSIRLESRNVQKEVARPCSAPHPMLETKKGALC